MIQNSRSCKQIGHESFVVNHCCTNYQCLIESRWCCQECIKSQIHLHGNKDNQHLVEITQLIKNLRNINQNQLKTKQNLQLLLKTLNVFERLIAEIKLEIQQTQSNQISYSDQLQIQENLKQIESLDDKQIWRLFSNLQEKSKQINLSYLKYYFENLQLQFYQFEHLLMDCKVAKTTKVIELEDLNKLYELNQQNKQKIAGHLQANQEIMAKQSVQANQIIPHSLSIQPGQLILPIEEVKEIHLSKLNEVGKQIQTSQEFEEDKRSQEVQLSLRKQKIQKNIDKIK
ncbi:hypothetical protein pb186bvf_015287 [Paramecium bursaria]